MTLIAMPNSATLVRFTLGLEDNVQINRSSWTGRRQVTGLPGAQYWKASFQPHIIYDPSVIKEWRAFLINLRGGANNFHLPVAGNQRSGSNPQVAAGANNGNTIPLKGLPANATILRAGDYMTVPLPSGHNRLVMLSVDLISNGAGLATAQFWPLLNEVPVTNQIVETIDPFCPMALTSSNNEFGYQNSAFSISFDVQESL